MPKHVFRYRSLVDAIKQVLEQQPAYQRFNEWMGDGQEETDENKHDDDNKDNDNDKIYADVTDGALWKEMEDRFRSTGRPATREEKLNADNDDNVIRPLHLGIQLNGDAYQTYGKRSPVKASALYVAILNLSSDLRFHLDYVIVSSIIPGQ